MLLGHQEKDFEVSQGGQTKQTFKTTLQDLTAEGLQNVCPTLSRSNPFPFGPSVAKDTY